MCVFRIWIALMLTRTSKESFPVNYFIMSVEKKMLKIVNKNKFFISFSGQALMIAESNGFGFEPTKFTYCLEEMPKEKWRKEKNIFHGFIDQFTFRVKDSLLEYIFGISHIS